MEVHAAHDELSVTMRIDPQSDMHAVPRTPWAHAYGPHALALLRHESDNATCRKAVGRLLDGLGPGSCVAVAGDLPRVLLAVLQHPAVGHVHAVQVRCHFVSTQTQVTMAVVAHAARAVGGPRSSTRPGAVHDRPGQQWPRVAGICGGSLCTGGRGLAAVAPPAVR